jgi:CheY-like chemotaxis protein
MSSSEHQQRERKHILCVNSEPEFLNLLRELLARREYNVTTTNFVPETYELIETLQPALIILDLVAGEKSGWDLLEQLARQASTDGIPLLITSTDPALLNRAQADPARYGDGEVLAKPFRADDLLEEVDRLIGEA